MIAVPIASLASSAAIVIFAKEPANDAAATAACPPNFLLSSSVIATKSPDFKSVLSNPAPSLERPVVLPEYARDKAITTCSSERPVPELISNASESCSCARPASPRTVTSL